jgi:histidinol-phosphate aminotransferase
MLNEVNMNLFEKTSKSVKAGKIYDLGHFHMAWENPDIRRLMGNEALYPPTQKVMDAVKAMADKLNYYPEDITTNLKLRQKIADYVGLENGADWVTVGNGSMEIIDMLPMTFIDEGDEVLLPTPEYSPYTRRPLLFGAKLITIRPGKDFSYTLSSFTDKITEKTKMIILSRPNAPTGYMVTRDLVAGLCATGCIVVVDEAYVEYSQQSLVDMLPEHKNLIISRTFSKALGLGGIRLGFILAHPEIIEYINRIRTPLNVNVLTQAAAMAALDDIDTINANIEQTIKTRDYFYRAITGMPGFKALRSHGNSVLVNCDETGKPSSFFCEKLFEAGFLVRNYTDAFGLEGGQYFRVTIGTREDMTQVFEILKNLL